MKYESEFKGIVGIKNNSVVKYFKKNNEDEFKTELFEILKQQKLASEMQKKIIDLNHYHKQFNELSLLSYLIMDLNDLK